MTPEQSTTVRVADALEACGIAYMLVGSLSSNFYGIPRSTKDADFVLQMKSAVGPDFAQKLGDEFALEPQLSFEMVTGTFKQLIRQKKGPFEVELFLLSQDEHDQSRFARRRLVNIVGHNFWLPSPEDVIVTKLRWARGKDKDDVREVMSVQSGKLDWSYIEKWCKQHGSLALMEGLRSSVPKV
jgi:hypothetical protein